MQKYPGTDGVSQSRSDCSSCWVWNTRNKRLRFSFSISINAGTDIAHVNRVSYALGFHWMSKQNFVEYMAHEAVINYSSYPSRVVYHSCPYNNLHHPYNKIRWTYHGAPRLDFQIAEEGRLTPTSLLIWILFGKVWGPRPQRLKPSQTFKEYFFLQAWARPSVSVNVLGPSLAFKIYLYVKVLSLEART